VPANMDKGGGGGAAEKGKIGKNVTLYLNKLQYRHEIPRGNL